MLKFFLPGLVLGLVIGAFVGAVGPTLLGADQPPLRPAAIDTSIAPPPMSRAEREAAEAAAEQLLHQSMTSSGRLSELSEDAPPEEVAESAEGGEPQAEPDGAEALPPN